MPILPSRNDRLSDKPQRGDVDVRALRSHGLTNVEIRNAVRLVDDAHLANQIAELTWIKSNRSRILTAHFRAADRFIADVGGRFWLRL